METAAWIDRIDRRFFRLGIPFTIQTIVFLTGVCYLLDCIQPTFSSVLTLDAEKILQGEIWRLVTFLIVPAGNNFLFLAVYLFCLWSVAASIEHEWGPLKMNIYLLICLLSYWIVTFSLYFYPEFFYATLPYLVPWAAPINYMPFLIGFLYWLAETSILSTLFVVYGTLYGDAPMTIYLIPFSFPARYVAIVFGGCSLILFLVGPFFMKIELLAAFSAYLFFFTQPLIQSWRKSQRNKNRLAQLRGES